MPPAPVSLPKIFVGLWARGWGTASESFQIQNKMWTDHFEKLKTWKVYNVFLTFLYRSQILVVGKFSRLNASGFDGGGFT